MKSLLPNLTIARTFQGWDIGTFAKKMRLPRQTISDYERQVSPVPLRRIKRFAKKLKVSAEFLMGHEARIGIIVPVAWKGIRDPENLLLIEEIVAMTPEERKKAVETVLENRRKQRMAGLIKRGDDLNGIV